MPDVESAKCRTCRGHRFCPECLGWGDADAPCDICLNTGDCPDCDGTGDEPEAA